MSKKIGTVAFCCFLFFLLLFLTSSLSLTHAATYYIDFQNGNDKNAGTSVSSPWKTIPGTRNTGDTDWQSSSWGGGTINSANKVPAGTIFKLKPGTSHTSSNGGKILLNSTYYNTNYVLTNPVTFQRDTTWPGASGSVTFDGTGITVGADSGYGLFHVNSIGGFVWDGVAGVSNDYDGFIIKNSPRAGISLYDSTTGNFYDGGKFYYIRFYNNFTCCTSTGTNSGQLYMGGNAANGGFRNNVIDHCEFDGNGGSFMGLYLGGGEPVINTTVSNSISHDHRFTDSNDDVGIGFMAQSSQVTFTNCTAYNNGKGWDLGQEGSDCKVLLTYKIINCTAYNNSATGRVAGYATGIGISGTSYVCNGNTDSSFILINSIIRDNYPTGVKVYGFAGKIILAHNVFDNNGTVTTNEEHRNLSITSDGFDDTNTINVYLYNNIFYKPGGGSNFLPAIYWKRTTNNISFDSDYNSWVQRGSELFTYWGYYYGAGGSCYQSLPYGTNGPGHASGYWWTYYSCSSEGAPVSGKGHYHADAHSKGTGATDTTLPPFTNVGNHDYTLTTHYAGTNLSGKSWYIPEMGKDRNGITRTFWDIGAYEFIEESTLAPPKNLRIPAN